MFLRKLYAQVKLHSSIVTKSSLITQQTEFTFIVNGAWIDKIHLTDGLILNAFKTLTNSASIQPNYTLV